MKKGQEAEQRDHMQAAKGGADRATQQGNFRSTKCENRRNHRACHRRQDHAQKGVAQIPGQNADSGEGAEMGGDEPMMMKGSQPRREEAREDRQGRYHDKRAHE
ncbi:hypothetical protein AA0535_0482 [Asaia krungthepensis NRIC 0535]|uniref:Uncharacterized protein n=1 Tax=Asaia krungthepensis NRIC 0535 TaxID=1307925 RepID=A0ABQ0PXY4_9PROT|nr:hypothetical protein AA0535_0482 [Asaia krungthepensis NRIC 0535]